MPPKYTPEKQLEVFWTGIAVTADDNQCWLWQRQLNHDGYGIALYQDRQQSTHRIMWKLVNGDIENGLEVCHSCDVRNCCNPKHLFLGTHTDNVRDMVNKGRRKPTKGESNPHHKLTLEQVRIIRQRFATEKITKIALAREYNIGNTQIRRILSEEHWKE